MARQLFEITNVDQFHQAISAPLIETVSSQILRDVKARLSGRGRELDDDQAEALKDFAGDRYRTLMMEAMELSKERMITKYVETFSKDELLELTEAFQRPAVQRMLKQNPIWATEMSQFAQQYSRENINRVLYDPLKEWLDTNVGGE